MSGLADRAFCRALGMECEAALKAIAERIRWHFIVTKAPGELFAVNNNYVAYMARFAMEREPRLAGFFSCRSVRVDSALCPTRSVVVSADTPEES